MTSIAHDLYLLVAVLGLAVSVSYGGQPVLCQGAFVAVGAVGVIRLERAGLPLVGAVLVAAAMAAVLGGVVAVLTRRLSGASLALSTWAMAWLAYAVLVEFPSVGGGTDGLTEPLPVRLHSDVLGISLRLTPGVHAGVAAVLCLVLVAALARWERGPAGLQTAALRASPALATSLGVPVARRRATALTVTAALGALAGSGTTLLSGVAAPGDLTPLLSLQLFVALLVAGSAPRVWAPVAGWIVVAAIPRVADRLASAAGLPAPQLTGVITAAVLVAVVVLRAPLRRVVRGPAPHAGALASPQPSASPEGSGVLVVRGLSVRLGGAGIVDGVDLDVRQGEIHALVGPNGSGKSTVLRALAGAVRPAAGRIEWRGEDVTTAGQPAMVRSGVTRTFQHTAELAGLAPYRQVRLAALARGGDADTALALTGLGDRADDDPGELGAGEQRLLQVARAVATNAVLLLLDEPAAGMSAGERQRLRHVLRHLAEQDVGVLLVEHDLALVADVADHVTVLDAGRVLAHGPPRQVSADPAVRAVYAGDLPLPEIAT